MTIANASMAMNQNLEIVPVINKIDLPHADPERAREEIESAVAIDATDAILASAKAGIGIPRDSRGDRRPSHPSPETRTRPSARSSTTLFDSYQGAVAYLRVKDGSVRKGDRVKMMSTGSTFDVDSVGVFRPGSR